MRDPILANSAALPAECCEERHIDPEKVDRVRAQLLDEEVYTILAETFQALSDPSRAKIVYCLLREELCVCDLATAVGLSNSAASQHLRLLRNLRLVTARRQGKMVYYSLHDDHIRLLLDTCLSHLQHDDTTASAIPGCEVEQ